MKMDSNCKRHRKSLNWDANLNLYEGERRKEEGKEGNKRKENFVLHCSPKTIRQSWWGIFNSKLPIQGVPLRSTLIFLPCSVICLENLMKSVILVCTYDRFITQQRGLSIRALLAGGYTRGAFLSPLVPFLTPTLWLLLWNTLCLLLWKYLSFKSYIDSELSIVSLHVQIF